MKKITAVLLICVVFSYYILAVSYACQCSWLEYLAWENEYFLECEEFEYDYHVIAIEDNEVVYVGTYEECYRILPDYEKVFGDCCIMPTNI